MNVITNKIGIVSFFIKNYKVHKELNTVRNELIKNVSVGVTFHDIEMNINTEYLWYLCHQYNGNYKEIISYIDDKQELKRYLRVEKIKTILK